MIIWVAFGFFLISYILIRLLYRYCWDRALEIEVLLPVANVHEGEKATIKEIVINDKFLPLPVLETRFYLDKGIRYTDLANAAVSDKTYRRDVFAAGIKRKISREFEISCVKRGYYKLEKVELISSDLFLKQKFLKAVQCCQEFYVYPKKVRSDRILLPYQRIMGDLLVRKKIYEDPFSFGGIRNYEYTDPMNRINWKASARNQELLVNMYESSIEQKVVILLDTYQNRNLLQEELNEEAIRIAAALGERFLMQGVEVTIISNSMDVESGELIEIKDLKGMGIPMLKQQLARIKRGEEKPILELMEQLTSDTYVVILSKNIEHQENFITHFQEFLWILPYAGDVLEEITVTKNMLPWKLESGDL